MVKIEQNRKQDRKRHRDEHIPDRNILPEMDEPAPIRGREESGAGGQPLQLDGLHATEVHEPRKEDDGQGGAVVLEEDADGVAEQGARAELAAGVGDHEDEQGGGDAQVEGGAVAEALEDLDALLQVDEGDVEAEDVAREPRHVPQPVARVGRGEHPVEGQRPQPDPAHEGQVVGPRRRHDVVDRAGSPALRLDFFSSGGCEGGAKGCGWGYT